MIKQFNRFMILRVFPVLVLALIVLFVLIVNRAIAQDKPTAPTQEQITEANVRIGMLRQTRDEVISSLLDQVALLRIELQRALEKAAACKPESYPGKQRGSTARTTWHLKEIISKEKPA